MTGTDRSPEHERGFTTLELMITCAILSIVFIIAGSVLYSLTVTANRSDASVTNEQTAATLLTQLSRDIRSAQSLSFPTSSPSTEVEFQDLQVTGSSSTTVPVIWAYDSGTGKLVREVQVGGSFQAQANFSATLANNLTTNPIFSYYTYTDPGTALVSTDSVSEFTTCTTTIGVDLIVASTTNGARFSYEASDQVALTNQLDTLTAPGNGTCK